ncbi:MAG: flagellar motor switch protein FliN [Phreatobacter sp.]|jgi:flagellar motor switch protein FliN/FliY|uniref:flagellar motor switch protein FliN n=1 Tax=Phreatobacter sp. TaxID=1966341 RepID=UPI004036C339
MSTPSDTGMPLPDLENEGMDVVPGSNAGMDFGDAGDDGTKDATDLEAVFDVPVNVSAVLGRSRMDVGELLKLGPGTVLELDRKVGEAIDIYVNDRLVARGEVVLVEDRLGVTMTEIIKAER